MKHRMNPILAGYLTGYTGLNKQASGSNQNDPKEAFKQRMKAAIRKEAAGKKDAKKAAQESAKGASKAVANAASPEGATTVNTVPADTNPELLQRMQDLLKEYNVGAEEAVAGGAGALAGGVGGYYGGQAAGIPGWAGAAGGATLVGPTAAILANLIKRKRAQMA